MNKPKIKGTQAETWVVAHMRSTYWPLAERRTLSGTHDKGDLNAHPDLVVEVKATSRQPSIPAWMDELDAEVINAGASYGILVMKTKGYAARQVGRFWTVMHTHTYDDLGYWNNVMGYPIWAPTPIEKWKSLDIEGWLQLAPVINYRARGREKTYTVMRFDDALELLARAGLGQQGRVTNGTFTSIPAAS